MGAEADLNVDWWGPGEKRRGARVGGQPHPPAQARRPDAQRLLKSSFFLLQSICGARLLMRFWWALSLATAREMLKSKMGSEEEEVDEGSLESCLLGLSWEFSCKEEEGVKCPPLRNPRSLASEKWIRSPGAMARVVRSQEQSAPQHVTSRAG